MLFRLDPSTIRFDDPERLWLLVVPAITLVLWGWQVARRRRDRSLLAAHRSVPVVQRFAPFGGLLFWLFVILATAATEVALARPRAFVSSVRTAGVDLVVLQDGSASMRVADVAGDRWKRSMRFLRVLGDSLSWRDDRLALALFAHIAAPQIRLTKDPNTFFFFLDHLSDQPPFRLEDDTTWDTNIELGINWGIHLVEKDQELHGKSPNVKAFILVSDGQAWSGAVAKALTKARDRGIPVYVVGVGTVTGGIIPEPDRKPDEAPHTASLDRRSLETIAEAGGGRYFELDRESDRDTANQIIDALRRRAGSRGVEETTEDLYWRFLFAAGALLCAGTIFLYRRTDLWLHAGAAAAALVIVYNALR